jgi:hypothetical protein
MLRPVNFRAAMPLLFCFALTRLAPQTPTAALIGTVTDPRRRGGDGRQGGGPELRHQ